MVLVLIQALGRVLLVVTGTAQGDDLHLHQALGGELHRLAQNVGAFLGESVR